MLSFLRRRLRAVASGDGGMSLIELLVAMVLSTLVGAMTLMTFISASSASSTTGDRLLGTANARVALQSWQSLIQVADAPPSGVAGACSTGATAHRFEWITLTDILFYAGVDNRAGDGTCTPPQLVWLALRNSTLLEAHYTYSSGTWGSPLCRTLTQPPHSTVTSSTLFTPNPSQVMVLPDLGQAFATSSPFATVTSCASIPPSFLAGAVSDTDTTANNTLAQVNTIGIDFVLADQTDNHTQSFDTTATVYGGTS